ncbi:MAG: CoA transferase subunit A [Bacillota bacterium]
MAKVATLEEALRHINDGTVLMYGGFGGVGTPPTIIEGILQKGVRNLVLIGNDAGFPDVGVGRLITAGRVRKMITSHIGSNPVAAEMMHRGELEVEFSPQGTLAERIRAGGMGLGGILTDVGIGTVAEEGKQKIRLHGREYLVESALTAQVAIVYADRADPFGNLTYVRSGRNFNPLVAMAADITIAEAREIVPLGALDPETVVTPGIFVSMVVPSRGVNWKWPWEGKRGS